MKNRWSLLILLVLVASMAMPAEARLPLSSAELLAPAMPGGSLPLATVDVGGGGGKPLPTASSPACPARTPADLADPEAVLWDQPLSTANQAAYVDQDMPDFSAYTSFLADDFVNDAPWSIDTIFVPGDGWSVFSTLNNATSLTWQIYADSGCVPIGDPAGGGTPPLWTLTLAPDDPQVTLGAGTPGGMPSDTTLNLATPLDLPPGSWWLVFYPTMEYGTYGQYGRQPADTTNGCPGQFINPAGAFGLGTDWQDWTVLGPTQPDIAFRLEGTAAVGYASFFLPFVPKDFYADGKQWDSSFNVSNTGTDPVTVRVFFLNELGGQFIPTALAYSSGTLSNPFTLGAGGSVEVLPFATADLPAGSIYSVAMTATGEIAAIANLTTWIDSPQSPYYNGSYSGVTAGSPEVFMPAVVQDYYDWNSHIAVQNAAGTAVGLDILFYTEGSSSVCHTVNVPSLPPYAPYYLDVGTLSLSGCDANADGYNGSVKIVASGEVVAVDNQTAATSVWGPAGRTQTYTGFSAGATDLYVPALYYGYYGWDSSINVQNMGTADAEVAVIYSDGFSSTATLPAGSSVLFYQYTEGQYGCHTAGTKFSASIQAISGGPLVAVVNAATNQPWPGGYAPFDQAQTYSALAVDTATDVVVFPQIMREYYGWYTSYTIQNATSADVSLLVSYGGMGSLCQDIPYGPIAPGANIEFYQGGPADALCPSLPGAEQPGNPSIGGYRGAVTVRVDGVGSIVGVANQTNFGHRVTSGETGDWSMTYNGINR